LCGLAKRFNHKDHTHALAVSAREDRGEKPLKISADSVRSVVKGFSLAPPTTIVPEAERVGGQV